MKALHQGEALKQYVGTNNTRRVKLCRALSVGISSLKELFTKPQLELRHLKAFEDNGILISGINIHLETPYESIKADYKELAEQGLQAARESRRAMQYITTGYNDVIDKIEERHKKEINSLKSTIKKLEKQLKNSNNPKTATTLKQGQKTLTNQTAA